MPLSPTELLIGTVLTLLSFIGLTWYRSRRQLLRTFSKLGIPGPEPRFWLGNLHFSNRDYVFNHMDTWFKRYGDYFGYYRGDKPVIVLRNLEMIHEVFIARFGDFPNRLQFRMNVVPFSSSVLALRGKHAEIFKAIKCFLIVFVHNRQALAPCTALHNPGIYSSQSIPTFSNQINFGINQTRL